MSHEPIPTPVLKDFFTDLQANIVAELEAFDGQAFRTDSWVRPELMVGSLATR